jgi:hypothetical protein
MLAPVRSAPVRPRLPGQGLPRLISLRSTEPRSVRIPETPIRVHSRPFAVRKPFQSVQNGVADGVESGWGLEFLSVQSLSSEVRIRLELRK